MRHRERPRRLAARVVPDLPSHAGRSTPNIVLADDQPANANARRARVAERPCPTCKSLPGDSCRTPSGRQASHTHQARLRPGRHELVSDESVWQAIEERGATVASVPFSGRAGRGGRVERIVLSRLIGGELVDLERWTGRDELATPWRRRPGIASGPSADSPRSRGPSCGPRQIGAG